MLSIQSKISDSSVFHGDSKGCGIHSRPPNSIDGFGNRKALAVVFNHIKWPALSTALRHELIVLAELWRWEHWGRLCVITSWPNEKGLTHTTCPVFVLKGECQSEKGWASRERHLQRVLRMCGDLVIATLGVEKRFPGRIFGLDTC